MPNQDLRLKFIKTLDPSEGQDDLLNQLTLELSEKNKVLWLVSGGSNIGIEVSIMSKLDDDLTANLEVMLCDERYGEVGHNQSNYFGLQTGGFDKKQASFDPVLMSGLSLNQTLSRFKKMFETKADWADIIIGQFGIGDDGHIVGILPHSPELNSLEPVVYYESSPYRRLSISLEALKRIDLVYVFCYGGSKRDALTRLSLGQETTFDLPSEILHKLKDVKVYNDQIGG